MQAILVRAFGGPEVLQLAETADPQLAPGHVLVDVHAVGVNPFDTYMRTGTYATKPPLPYTPGSDGAGVVAAVGAGVSGVKGGDRVFFCGTAANKSYGAYASKVTCQQDQVHPLPDQLSFAQGAGVGVPYATAWRALFDRARAQAGDTVLVHGASGGVGIAATQLATAAGLTVVGTASTDEGRQAVRDAGAAHVLDHSAAGYLDTLQTLTNGRGADVIVESLANVNLDRDLDAIASGGRVVVVGNRGRIEIDPRKTMGKEAAILGMSLWSARGDTMQRAFQAISAGLRLGTLVPRVGHELPLANAARAHELVMQSGARGKVVLTP